MIQFVVLIRTFVGAAWRRRWQFVSIQLTFLKSCSCVVFVVLLHCRWPCIFHLQYLLSVLISAYTLGTLFSKSPSTTLNKKTKLCSLKRIIKSEMLKLWITGFPRFFGHVHLQSLIKTHAVAGDGQGWRGSIRGRHGSEQPCHSRGSTQLFKGHRHSTRGGATHWRNHSTRQWRQQKAP